MTNTSATADIGALYCAARQRITALVTEPEVDLEAMVPSTPAWRVHDVIAHLAGIATDAMTGNMAGAPGEAWTEAQVARGRDRTLAELLAEWAKFGEMLESFLSSPDGAPASAAVMDVHSHEADIQHAFGLPFSLPGSFLDWSMGRMRDGLHTDFAEASLSPITLKVADAELFRARLGRRTSAEVSAYDWSSDPASHLATFFLFGPAEHSIGEQL